MTRIYSRKKSPRRKLRRKSPRKKSPRKKSPRKKSTRKKSGRRKSTRKKSGRKKSRSYRLRGGMDEGAECPICMLPIRNTSRMSLSCCTSSIYHNNCIKKCDKCALCRIPFSTNDINTMNQLTIEMNQRIAERKRRQAEEKEEEEERLRQASYAEFADLIDDIDFSPEASPIGNVTRSLFDEPIQPLAPIIFSSQPPRAINRTAEEQTLHDYHQQINRGERRDPFRRI